MSAGTVIFGIVFFVMYSILMYTLGSSTVDDNSFIDGYHTGHYDGYDEGFTDGYKMREYYNKSSLLDDFIHPPFSDEDDVDD